MKEDPLLRLSTGDAGLDEILGGGLIPARTSLLRGGPGGGKTTVGLHFLTCGDPHAEEPLLITIGEPEEQIRITQRPFEQSSRERAELRCPWGVAARIRDVGHGPKRVPHRSDG